MSLDSKITAKFVVEMTENDVHVLVTQAALSELRESVDFHCEPDRTTVEKTKSGYTVTIFSDICSPED